MADSAALCDFLFFCEKEMARLIVLFLFIVFQFNNEAKGQKIYDPSANPEKEISNALIEASSSDKHVLLMIGGNWCPWCRMLHGFFEENQKVNALLEKRYEMVKVNYSKENKNLTTLAKYDFPQRFGFPVLVVLDSQGKRIHTQSTVCLEEGKGYNEKRVLEFLKNWSSQALDPSGY